MPSVKPLLTSTIYAPPDNMRSPQQAGAQPSAKVPSAPSVEVASSARMFSALADLALGTTSAQQGGDAAAAQGAVDGDESALGAEANDGDADDAPLPSQNVTVNDAGIYSIGARAA